MTAFILLCLLLQQRPLTAIADDLQRLADELRARPETILVPCGSSIQTALTTAAPGDTILLEPGCRYVGTLTLGVKSGTVTIASAAPDRRVTPADAPLMATIASGGAAPAVQCTGCANWTFRGVQFEPRADGLGDVIVIDGGDSIAFDRVLIVGGTNGQKRGIRGNGKHITLTQSHIANIWAPGQDSQAFAAWDGAGPYTITDNYLEAASENVMFGGADSKSVETIPSDILIERNTFRKPPEWKPPAGVRYSGKAVKNLLEFKVGKRVIVRDNVFDGVWTDAQDGYAWLLKSVNQNGTAPWTVLEDVEFSRNTVVNAENGINILGISADQPGGKTTRINIHDNDLTVTWTVVKLGGNAGPVTFDANQFTHGGNLMTLYGTPYASDSCTITNNWYKNVPYGIKGDGTASGTPSLTRYCGAFVYTGNIVW